MVCKTKNLALFDFDGTITKDDSFLRFILYTATRYKILYGILILLPHLILYKLGKISNGEIKEKVFKYFFSGWLLEDIEMIARRFSKEILPLMCKKEILDRIHWHSEKNHRIIIVSASFEFYLKPFCENVSLELLGTQIKVVNGRVTGDFLSRNCYAAEKVNRILSHLDISDYYIYAYGNSRGDYEMFNIADESFLVKNNQIIKNNY